jgi:hypothetical protein
MTEIRVYKKTDFTPLATLREDIVTHIRDIFPTYRSFVENVSIYNDENEEVLFFTNTGRLAYVKILSSNRVQSIDYVIDDYLKVQERWTRFAKNDQRYKEHLSYVIEMVVIAEHFDADFIKRVRFLISGKVTLLEVRTLRSSAGEIAYSLSEIMTLKSSETAKPAAQASAVAEPAVLEPTVEQAFESSIEEKVLHDEQKTVSDDFELPTIEPDEAEALRSSMEGQGRDSDFFERAQLNAEEEHEFFLLNQQLSENTERKKV